MAEEDGKEKETMPCIFKSTHDNGFVQFRLFTVKKNKQTKTSQSGGLKRMSHQWEKRQVASNSKINVSAWPALCRPCWKGSQSAERLNPPWGSKRFDFILLPLQMITDRKGNRKLNMAENTEEKRKRLSDSYHFCLVDCLDNHSF